MGIKERKEREKHELRARILDAARELILEQGVEAVSMRKIAERIEYSPTAIYQHFADKDALLHAMCQRDFEAFAEEIQEKAKSPDPIRRIREAGRVYLRFAQEYPDHFRVMFMTPMVYPKELDEADRKAMGNPDLDGYAFLRQAVADGIAAGRFRPELTDPDLVAQTLWAAVHGVAALTVTHQHDPWLNWAPLEARQELMLEAVLRGMVREGTEARRHEGTKGGAS